MVMVVRVNVKVIPNAKRDEVVDGDVLKVYVRAPAVDGKANKAVIKALAEFFNVRKSCIRIVLGERSREKVVDVIRE
jgi:uncharacterized protein (TIGR00251 family)